MSGPLAGLRVLEVGHMLTAPYWGMLLADLGAEVVKIEPPGGDLARTVGPHSIGPHNAYLASLNCRRQSVTLEQALACDQAICRAMMAAIDTPTGPLRVLGNPIKIAGGTTTYAAPPLLGEHNARRTGVTPREEGATP